MIGGFLNIIRANSEELAYALFYRFMSRKFRDYVFSKKGQNINNLNIVELSGLSIDLPKDLKSFAEQVRSLNNPSIT
jgi:hypothetical protein